MKWLALLVIRIYKWHSKKTPHVCRYVPTCSSYGYEAISRFGFGRGMILMSERLKRCTGNIPRGTLDPVPTSIKE
jgi:hypothetical protein